MFSGIVETTAVIQSSQERAGVLQITLERPNNFTDIATGDSIAVDGVCLTVETFSPTALTFALGPETLRVTGLTPSGVKGRVVNLERSLRLGDRLHGHLVTGHVDVTAQVVGSERQGETLTLTIALPAALKTLIWPKGSIAINGVSLTINAVTADIFQVGLIPETLKRTNLGALNVGAMVNLEADNMARGLVRLAELRGEMRT
ncbi:MAG: riboflavin synthase [Bdellovibrionales bacterium]|nr:riboflavin synthase [Bdellovibrionales bacterium]